MNNSGPLDAKESPGYEAIRQQLLSDCGISGIPIIPGIDKSFFDFYMGIPSSARTAIRPVILEAYRKYAYDEPIQDPLQFRMEIAFNALNAIEHKLEDSAAVICGVNGYVSRAFDEQSVGLHATAELMQEIAPACSKQMLEVDTRLIGLQKVIGDVTDKFLESGDSVVAVAAIKDVVIATKKICSGKV